MLKTVPQIQRSRILTSRSHSRTKEMGRTLPSTGTEVSAAIMTTGISFCQVWEPLECCKLTSLTFSTHDLRGFCCVKHILGLRPRVCTITSTHSLF